MQGGDCKKKIGIHHDFKLLSLATSKVANIISIFNDVILFFCAHMSTLAHTHMGHAISVIMLR